MKAKWNVELTASIEVEADDEDEAIGIAQAQILDRPDDLNITAETEWQQCQGCMDWFAPDDVPLSDEGFCLECEEEEEEEDEEDDDDEESREV